MRRYFQSSLPRLDTGLVDEADEMMAVLDNEISRIQTFANIQIGELRSLYWKINAAKGQRDGKQLVTLLSIAQQKLEH